MRQCWLVLCVALLAAQPAAGVTDSERLQVYREFRTLFDDKRYQEALPIAQRLVELTEEQYGQDDRALVNPLVNLATTCYRLGDYPAAEQHYLRSVRIIENSSSATDRLLLKPLHGLGTTYFAAGKYADASVALKRAVDLSRNLDGLFNVEQLGMLEQLIASYTAQASMEAADKEHQYAFRIAESAYGKNDVRMLGPIDRYARWFEHIGRYTTARNLHSRALSIAEQTQGKGSPLAIDALRGIARTYRLEYLQGSEETARRPGDDPFSNDNLTVESGGGNRPHPDGERALQMALEAAEKSKPDDHLLRGEILVDLGDWYLSGGALGKGIDALRRAWKELDLAGKTDLLSKPELLAYKAPPSSITRTRLSPEDAEERFVEVQFTVTKAGRTANIVKVAGDAPESQEKSVLSAVRRARYRPRFEAGEPVDTPQVTIREQIAIRKDS
jgi:tetratricopeptide (TPR) repeat protein